MAERSLAWMTELLPPPSTRDLDAALPEALARAIEDLERSADRTKATQDVLKELKLQRWVFAQRRATWKDWAVLAAVEPAKKSQDLIETLRTTAAEFEAHPRFQNELREMITGVFDCARLGLERYQSWKERLRLVDYVDMLERALGLLDRPEVARELAERLGMVVVDEFQDTSPIQLELFLRLHQLTHRSTWVGDRKQCIFEFAGADPQLMDSVTRWVADNGGSSEQLPFNYRSRPELVELCSELFTHALAPHGYARAEVAVSPRREIRYCPRPISGRTKALGFVDREEQSQPGRDARQDERCERARLLYVGFTRARDHPRRRQCFISAPAARSVLSSAYACAHQTAVETRRARAPLECRAGSCTARSRGRCSLLVRKSIPRRTSNCRKRLPRERAARAK